MGQIEATGLVGIQLGDPDSFQCQEATALSRKCRNYNHPLASGGESGKCGSSMT